MSKKIAVIGAGIAGLAVAIRCAAKGYEVVVLESNDEIGGKIAEFRKDGFRFDMGPSLFTLPEQVTELLDLVDKEIPEFPYSKLDLISRYFYEDGTMINAWQDVERFAEEIEEKTSVKGSSILEYLGQSKKIYDHTAPTFIYKPLKKWKTWLDPLVLKALINLPAEAVLRTVHQVNSLRFSDHRVVQLFDRYTTYNGSDPYKAPAILNVIPHLEHNLGAYFPDKGMYSIVEALGAVAVKLGVRFHTNSKVDRIIHENGVIKGIRAKGQFLPYDIVISNMDVEKTYKHLLRDNKRSKELSNIPKSTSALIFYWGMDTEFSQLDLHNIFFSKNYKQEFDCLFNKKYIYHDPTVYIFISSKKVKDDAPTGKENWFVMINVPENIGQDWKSMINDARENILKKLERVLKKAVRDHILFEHICDPIDLEIRTSATGGALYGANSNTRMSAFLRHQNEISNIKNLYFCGGTVHPGGGIPLCLASAKIVEELILTNSHK